MDYKRSVGQQCHLAAKKIYGSLTQSEKHSCILIKGASCSLHGPHGEDESDFRHHILTGLLTMVVL